MEKSYLNFFGGLPWGERGRRKRKRREATLKRANGGGKKRRVPQFRGGRRV